MILWSGWSRLVAGFKLRWRTPWQIVNYELHNLGGILAVLFLVLIASTGVGITFWTHSEQVLYWLTHTPKPPESISIPVDKKTPLALDELLSKADAALPGAKTIEFALPATPQTAIKVRKKLPQEADPFGSSLVYLNQYTGEVLRVDNALKASLAAKIINSMYPLHIGYVGGLGLRILYVFIGLTLSALFITGFALWWSHTYGLKLTSIRRR